jgi:hypothetical protein
VIERLVENDGLRVVCAEYSLESSLLQVLERA